MDDLPIPPVGSYWECVEDLAGFQVDTAPRVPPSRCETFAQATKCQAATVLAEVPDAAEGLKMLKLVKDLCDE